MRTGPVPRASVFDVQRGGAEQVRNVQLEALLEALNGQIVFTSLPCTATVDEVPVPLMGSFSVPTPITIPAGLSNTQAATLTLSTAVPLPSSPILFRCIANGTALGVPVTTQGQLTLPWGDTVGESTTCVSNATMACLLGQFRIQMTYRASDGRSGTANVASLTSDTGYFWFFEPRNVEMIVRVLDGCAINQRYWVFAGGLTDVEVTTRVTNTRDGTTRTYSNPLNREAREARDTDAFNCPGAGR